MVGTEFFVFGEWVPMEPRSGGECLNDIWVFDWTTKMWSGEKLLPVSRYAAVTCDTVGDDMVIIHTYM